MFLLFRGQKKRLAHWGDLVGFFTIFCICFNRGGRLEDLGRRHRKAEYVILTNSKRLNRAHKNCAVVEAMRSGTGSTQILEAAGRGV